MFIAISGVGGNVCRRVSEGSNNMKCKSQETSILQMVGSDTEISPMNQMQFVNSLQRFRILPEVWLSYIVI